MLPQRFKLIFLAGGTSKKREFSFTKKLFILTIGAFALAFFLLSISTGFFLYEAFSSRAFESMSYRNAVLDEQLRVATEKLESLTARVEVLSENGNDFRTFAHMPQLDPETQQMGIGGSLPYTEPVNIGADVLLEGTRGKWIR